MWANGYTYFSLLLAKGLPAVQQAAAKIPYVWNVLKVLLAGQHNAAMVEPKISDC